MRPLEFGRLRHRVTVQSRSLVDDSFGQPQPTWTAVGTYWAEVKPLRGREAEQARQVRAETTHKVTLRVPTTITPEHRLLFESTRVLNILEVIDVGERDHMLELLCVEELTGGET